MHGGDAEPQRFRILSLEGGGIVGDFSASALAAFEEDSQQRCVDHFDLIAGTSTGGIIAIGLGMGIPAREIQDFYVNYGARIFPKPHKPHTTRPWSSAGPSRGGPARRSPANARAFSASRR